MAGKTIHIGNLCSQIGEETLTAFFSCCGQITNIKMAGDPSYPSRFAFIEFAEPSQAAAACQLSGHNLGGKQIKVSLSKSPISSPYKPKNYMPTTQYMYPYYYGYNYGYGYTQPMYQSPMMSYPTHGPHQHYKQKDANNRTIYVAGVDSTLTEKQLLDFFAFCGQITNYRLCGDTSLPTRFAFFEFAHPESAYNAMSLTGSVLGNHALKISPSKTSIQQAAPPLLSQQQRELVEKTVHVGGVDINLTEDELREFFNNVTQGQVNKVVLAGDTKENHQTRFAFIEFHTKEAAKEALTATNQILGGKEIRVSPSRSPILAGSKIKSQYNPYMNHYPYYGYYGFPGYFPPKPHKHRKKRHFKKQQQQQQQEKINDVQQKEEQIPTEPNVGPNEEVMKDETKEQHEENLNEIRNTDESQSPTDRSTNEQTDEIDDRKRQREYETVNNLQVEEENPTKKVKTEGEE